MMKRSFGIPILSLICLFSFLISGCEKEAPTQVVAGPPEAVTDLQVEARNDTQIRLTWTVPDGDSMTSSRSQYEFHYGALPLDEAAWDNLTEIYTRNIYGEPGNEAYVDIYSLQPATTYVFAMRTKDAAGLWSGVSNLVEAETTCGVSITSPGSGYSVCYGDTVVLRWHQQECHGESMRVQLLHDGGVARNLGTAQDGEFKWASRPVDDNLSGYQFRVTDLSSGEFGESEEFSITPDCMLNFTFPIGGEYLCEDMPVNLRWTKSTCCGSRVKLVLLHNGQEAETIVEETSAYYSYSWYPRQWRYFTNGYSIRIEDLDTGATAVTDYTFSINLAEAPLLVTPNGGERLHDDQIVSIEWIPAECRNSVVTLELWQNDAYCERIARYETNDGFYEWTVSSCSPDSNNYKIRVVDGELDDFSDQSFTIARECQLELLHPVGLENYCNGIPMEIRWDATRWCGNTVNIDLSQENIVRQSLAVETPNDGSFEWLPEQFEGLDWGYKIVISDPSTGYSTTNESAFTLWDLCLMDVHSPHAGAVLEVERGYSIGWTRPSCCSQGETILLLQHGVVCDTIPHPHPYQNEGVWWIAEACSEDPEGYNIRIVSPENNYWSDGGIFSIAQGCWMDLEDLDTEYCSGAVVPVRWETSSHCGDFVRIELLLDGEVCRVLAGSAPNNTSFDWTAQQFENHLGGYQIRVTNIEEGLVLDTEGTFSITGTTTHVSADGSGDYPTLRAALEVSCPGDTVMLADGLYTGYDNCQVEIKDGITVRSASGNPELCVLDREMAPGGITLRDGTLEGVTVARVASTAVQVWGNYTPLIRNCIFRENLGDIGGALRCNNGGTPRVEDCLFTENQATRGGAVGSYDAGGTFVNCTFYGNVSGSGSAINAYNDTDFVLENCLLVGNTGSDVVVCQFDGSISLECCDIFGHTINYPPCIAGYSGSLGNIAEDPLFCDVGAGDFRLQAGSPCLPSGNSCSGLIGVYGGCR